MKSSLERWDCTCEILKNGGLPEAAAAADAALGAARSIPMRVPVLGEVKAGKSRLLARLLGAEADPMLVRDVEEATARCIEVRTAPAPYRALVGAYAGGWEEISDADDDRWQALVRGREPLPPGARLEVGGTASWLAPLGVTLLDTPGLNSTTEGLFEITWSAATSSALAIYTMRASELLKATDLSFLRSVRSHVGGMILVITQVDRLGVASVQDPEVARLVRHVQTRVTEEFQLTPRAVLATAAALEDDEAAGLVELRAAVIDAAWDGRDEILAAATASQVLPGWRHEHSQLQVRVDALEQAGKKDRASFQAQIGQLEGRLILDQSAAEAARRKVNRDATRLRLEALQQIESRSSAVLDRLERDLEGISTSQALDAYAFANLRAEIDGWRTACVEIVESKLVEAAAEGHETAREALRQHLDNLGADFTSLLPTVMPPVMAESEGAVPQALEALEQHRKALIEAAEQLRRETGNDEILVQLSELLSQATREREAIVYEPLYEEILLDQGRRGVTEFGKWVGRIGDVALTLAPIPTGGPLGKMLAKLPAGTTIKKGIDTYNKSLAMRDAAIWKAIAPAAKALPATKGPLAELKQLRTKKHTLAWFQNAMANLSLETWGERLGDFVGGAVCPDRIETIENLEVRAEYQRRVKPYADRMFQLRLQMDEAQRQQRTAVAELESTLSTQAAVEVELERLRHEQGQDAERRKHELEELALLMAKTQLLGNVQRQLQDRQGQGWYAQLRASVESSFSIAGRELEEQVTVNAERGLEEIRVAMREADAASERGNQSREAELAKLRGQSRTYEQAIAIWSAP